MWCYQMLDKVEFCILNFVTWLLFKYIVWHSVVYVLCKKSLKPNIWLLKKCVLFMLFCNICGTKSSYLLSVHSYTYHWCILHATQLSLFFVKIHWSLSYTSEELISFMLPCNICGTNSANYFLFIKMPIIYL